MLKELLSDAYFIQVGYLPDVCLSYIVFHAFLKYEFVKYCHIGNK